MTTDRRNFITACLSGAAWLMGWKPVGFALDLGESSDITAISIPKNHAKVWYVMPEGVPRCGEPHPFGLKATVVKVEATELQASHWWQVIIEYDHAEPTRAMTQANEANEIFRSKP